MLIKNLDVKLKDFGGKTLKDGTSGGDPIDMTLKSAIVGALVSDADGKVPGPVKFERGELARKIHVAKKQIELNIDEIKMVKEMIGHGWPTIVVTAAYQYLPE